MKILFLLLLLPVVGFTQKITDPVVYNDKIVDYQNDIITAMLELSGSVGSDGYTLEMCEEIRLKTLKIANQSIAGVNKMQAFNGNDDLRKAALQLFQFYERIISNDYKDVMEIVYKEDVSDEDIARLEELSVKVTEDETALDLVFEEAQIAFAEKNGFDLKENELQEDIDDLND